MVEQKTPRGRHASGSARRTPTWALAVLLLTTGLLVPLGLLTNSEDLAFSSSTSGTQRAGGETEGTSSSGGSSYVCRDAPVRYEVDGRRYETTTPVDGECLTSGDTRTVTVRYDPDEPDLVTTNPRQTLMYAFIVLAALGFLATLVAVVRRVLSRGRQRGETAPTGTLSP